MRYLLALLIFTLATADVFGWTLSLAPGLSVKNAIIYVALLALAARFVVRGGLRMELPQVHLWFGVLIVYATLTWLAAGLLLDYPSYTLLQSGIDLKANLLDNALVFALYLYGARTLGDARFLLKCILLAVSGANAIAIGNVAGLFHLGISPVGVEGNLTGRVFGAFGHANETAALIVCLLPAYTAAAWSSRGLERPLWILAGVASATLMIMSGSRGAFVGLTLAVVLGSYICRGVISWRRAAVLALILLAIIIPVMAFVSIRFGDILVSRVVEMFHDPGTSGDERLYIWRPVFDRMMANPLAMVSGFGWATYEVMGFIYSAHNYYLLLWFELGIVGLGSYLLLIRSLVITARRAAGHASGEMQAYLIAFIYGIVGICGAILFSVIYRPWLYAWMYFGLTMRMAVLVAQQTAVKEPTGARVASAAAARVARVAQRARASEGHR